MYDFWHVHGFDWLSELGPHESASLHDQSTEKRFGSGEIIFGPAGKPRSVYLLERGLVRIYRMSAAGAEATFGYVQPGEIFGELAAFTDASRDSYAEAAQPAVVWIVPVEVARAIFARHPGVVVAITRQLGGRLKRIESRVEHLIFRDARSRVARIMLELAEDFGRAEGAEGDERVIDLRLSQQDLATLAGTTRQTVNAVLRELERSGTLRRERSRIIITGMATLQALS